MPPPPTWLAELDALYDARIRVAGLEDRNAQGVDVNRDARALVSPKVDVMVEFERPLLERGGTIEDVGDLGDRPARRTIDATGLYIVPFDPPGASTGRGRGSGEAGALKVALSRPRCLATTHRRFPWQGSGTSQQHSL